MCDKCDYRAKNRNALRIHISRRHAEDPNYPCKECDKRFFSKRMLKVSKSEGPTIRIRYALFILKSIFFRLFQMHQVSHSEDLPFKCPLCDVATKTKMAIQVSEDAMYLYKFSTTKFIILYHCRFFSWKKSSLASSQASSFRMEATCMSVLWISNI